MSGQTLTDRIAAAQYQLTGSEVARAVCKATTHEVMAPKKKHLECYDMSTFIRRYARYLNEKAYAYRAMAFDFTRVKKGADGVMRTMAPDKLLKAMPALQTQVDTLLEFDVHPKDLNNGIINAAFLLLFKDLIKLFASYNDGIINLLEKYFKMKKSECKDSLDIYKKFLTRVTKIAEFMKIAEQVGVDKNDIPDISYAPSSILESLEAHMNSLEGKKGSPTKGSPTNNVSPTSTPAKSAAAVPTLEPPRAEATPAAAETATDSLLDLDPLSSSGPSTGASAAPTSWGVDSNTSATPTTTAAEAAVSLAPPPSAAGASSGSADLLGDPFTPAAGTADNSHQSDLFSMQPVDDSNSLFSSVAPNMVQASVATTTSTVAPAASPALTIDLFAGFFDPMPDSSVPKTDPNPSLDLFSAAFDGFGDVLMPAMAPQGGDLDSAMANMASNLAVGNHKDKRGRTF
ncbi:hypothetical protein cypCar_00019664 [Cyprinus carpio]|nr:hypothetical protein cypCar_00019664 [Cyprinus carpio]